MEKDAKIYVAGHRGLAGSAIVRKLLDKGYTNLILKTRAELDLCSQSETADFFVKEKPDYVFLAAAKVGGIHANNTFPAEFILQNLLIQTHVIHESWRNNVKRLLFLGSSCIYPKDCPQPIKEEYLHSGFLEPTNRPYALAKIAGIEMCWSYNRQYGTQFLSAMPTNLYGPGDNYHPENSHVLPALIGRFHEAKIAKAPIVTVWGTGIPRREFLYSDEMADACIFLMELVDKDFTPLLAGDRNDGLAPILNIGTGYDLSIRELAELVKKIVGYQGEVIYDSGKPDGAFRKLMDVSRLSALGWKSKIELKEGLNNAYQDYLANVYHLTQ